jgi:hypothetical protein
MSTATPSCFVSNSLKSATRADILLPQNREPLSAQHQTLTEG